MDTLKELSKIPDAPFEGMTASELAVHRGALQRSLERLAAIKTNCGSCKQFEMGTCSMHGDVPIEFQKAEGECPDWAYDGIPF